MTAPRALLLLATVGGCALLPVPEAPPECEPRIAFYPDGDGDGVGDAGSAIYLGCDAPDGYVDVPPPDDDTVPVDSDTERGDTDPAQTDPPVDTDPSADTDTDVDTDATD